MGEPLDEQYLVWLYRQVASVRYRNPARTYWSLLRVLYCKEFTWFVPNDDNRVEDGRDLRYEFIESHGYIPNTPWMELGCSMLEMLVALSRRLDFESDEDSVFWFWKLMDNLKLGGYNDRFYKESDTEVINEILDRVIERRYSRTGEGGLFPLYDPPRDQRKVEIWYQLNAYLLERT